MKLRKTKTSDSVPERIFVTIFQPPPSNDREIRQFCSGSRIVHKEVPVKKGLPVFLNFRILTSVVEAPSVGIHRVAGL